MRISEAASIAAHTMVMLASEPGAYLSARESSGRLGVSEAHLAKVMQRLARAGLVKSVRGPGGGFMLGRAPGDVTLLQVIETIDGPCGAGSCLFDSPVCAGEECIMGDILNAMASRVRDYLGKTTLEDLKKDHVFAG